MWIEWTKIKVYKGEKRKGAVNRCFRGQCVIFLITRRKRRQEEIPFVVIGVPSAG